jgi:hypothetical protein
MQFGDKSRFAIALELDRDYGGAWLFGRICYWIDGEMIGLYDLGTSLRDALFLMTYIQGDSGKRCCQPLLSVSKEEIFSLISAAIDEEGDEIYRYIPENFMPTRFDVRIGVDVFDLWKIFLVEGIHEAKLLYKRIDSSQIDEIILPPGEFDFVFGKAFVHLKDLYEIEIEK